MNTITIEAAAAREGVPVKALADEAFSDQLDAALFVDADETGFPTVADDWRLRKSVERIRATNQAGDIHE